nr:pyruvate kinase 1, cytosolic-like isoform X1 [Nicotiana tomentosiformis]
MRFKPICSSPVTDKNSIYNFLLFLFKVKVAIKVKTSVIICFTSSGRASRLIAKYRPAMPVLSVVIPRLKINQLKWSSSGAFETRQSLIVRGLFPMLVDPRHPVRHLINLVFHVCCLIYLVLLLVWLITFRSSS